MKGDIWQLLHQSKGQCCSCLFSDKKKVEASTLFQEKVMGLHIAPTVPREDARFDEHRKRVLEIQKEEQKEKEAVSMIEKNECFVRGKRQKLSPTEHDTIHGAFSNLRLDQLTGSGLLKSSAIDDAVSENADLKRIHATLVEELGVTRVKRIITASLRKKTRAFYDLNSYFKNFQFGDDSQEDNRDVTEHEEL